MTDDSRLVYVIACLFLGLHPEETSVVGCLP